MGLAGCEVAVVGAGIAGLAAATALAQRGARVRVFEQAAALGEVGAGIQVAPNGVAVLEALGLRAAVAGMASPPRAIELRDDRGGGLVARVPLGPDCVARYGRPYWHLHRADLLDVLAAAAVAAGVALDPGVRITGVGAQGDRLRLSSEAGSAGAAQLVVAADGVRSGLRAAWFGAAEPRFAGYVAWRGLVAAERLPMAVPEAAQVRMGGGRHLVTYPLRSGRLVNFVAVEARAAWTAEGWTAPDDPANLRRAFAGWSAPATALLAAVDRTFLWGLFDHPPLPRWVAGHCALVGDACHPMLPFLAQGATMALEDAWVLAAELDAADGLGRGLAAYEARRRARTARVQRAAARNGRIFHLDGAARVGAHLGLRAVSAVAPGRLLARFDWLYGHDVTAA